MYNNTYYTALFRTIRSFIIFIFSTNFVANKRIEYIMGYIAKMLINLQKQFDYHTIKQQFKNKNIYTNIIYLLIIF